MRPHDVVVTGKLILKTRQFEGFRPFLATGRAQANLQTINHGLILIVGQRQRPIWWQYSRVVNDNFLLWFTFNILPLDIEELHLVLSLCIISKHVLGTNCKDAALVFELILDDIEFTLLVRSFLPLKDFVFDKCATLIQLELLYGHHLILVEINADKLVF